MKWQTLQRDVHIYSSSVKAEEATLPSGTTDADIQELAMKLYCLRAGKKGPDGNDIYSLPLKYKEVEKYLSEHPKFGGRSEGEEAQLVKSAMGRGPGHSSEGDIEGEVVGINGKRPRGIKSTRRDGKRKREDVVFSETLVDIKDQIVRIGEVMQLVAERQEKSRAFEHDFMLLQILLVGSAPHRRVLERVTRGEENASGVEEVRNDERVLEESTQSATRSRRSH